MNVQIENGYTKIANELYEAIIRLPLSGYEFRVLNALIRKTYGFEKKADYIALSQISELTGIAKPHVSKTVKNLISMKIVTKLGNKLGINKNYLAWKVTKLGNSKKALNLLPKSVTTVTKLGNEKLPKSAPQKKKENITKEKILTSKNSRTACSEEELLQVSKEFNVPLPSVENTHASILDDIESGEFKHKTVYFTLRKWVRLGIERGYIKKIKNDQPTTFVPLPQMSPEEQAAASAKAEEIRTKIKTGGLSSLSS